ncbi:Cell wall assembly regulator SMI1 [Saccharopolyspora kobensis]|uniref:Cell wall assembly regulator SMI1 n=1 Tax=Saccharopolyspora kobensis TaxID=146035 RepID=A0A1H6ED68_9PSEU|nr:SMI1/KNR4 family protein [Saccharopolyspora kobensis]SEG95747.1 Cell wall assembly regulator SMI1 [Saccharopolyspora kobensis]SFD53603.1 Cell wall assembly regulator SMI1 [Saccharopolyspora kobensis]
MTALPTASEPTLYEIDDEFLVPDRGDEQEGPANAVPAGDPDEAVRLFHEYRRRVAEILGFEEELPEPATEEDLDAAEERLGFALPPDLRALYGVADGDGDDVINSVFDGHPWHPLDELGDEEEDWLLVLDWEYEPQRRVVFDSEPSNAVRRSVLRPGWIPFADDTGGNWLAVDMDPGPEGRPGQVIAIGVDYSDGPLHVADSVTTLLRRQVEALERGDYRVHDKSIWIDADLPNGLAVDRERSWYTDAASVGAETGQARPRVQKVRVSDVADLAFLAAIPNVRSLSLSGGGPLDLSPLRDRPVEYLELELGAADLAGLAGHPELRSLSVSAAQPVDLAPLRAVPRLWALDIADASIADLTAVTELEGLRFLELTREQWLELRDDLPPLAVVGIHPHRPEREWPLGTRWNAESGEPPR